VGFPRGPSGGSEKGSKDEGGGGYDPSEPP
jgi:hypothetical protein